MKLEEKIIKLIEDIQLYKKSNYINEYDCATLYNYYNDLKNMIDFKELDSSKYELIKKLFNKLCKELKFLKGKGFYR